MNRNGTIILGLAIVLAVGLFHFTTKSSFGPDRSPHAGEPGAAGQPEATVLLSRPAAKPPANSAPPSRPSAAQPLMTPQRAAEELEKARQMENISMKRIRCGNILFQLVQAGYLQEAWDLADATPGALRDHELTRIMEADKVPAETRLSLINGLTDERDQKSALNGFCDSMGIEDILAMKGSFPEMLTDPQLQKKFAVSCTRRISGTLEFLRDTQPEGYKEKSQALVRRVAEMAGQGNIPVTELRKVLAQDEDGSSFAKWNLISGISLPETDPAVGEMRRSVISSMILADTGKAMEVLGQQTDSTALADGLDFWYQQDPGGANRWLQGTGINLPPARRDQVLAAAVKLSLKDQDLKTARAWADHISDPALRARLLEPPLPVVEP